MKDIYDEKQVEALAEDYIKKVSEKIKKLTAEIGEDIYSDLSYYLHDHYQSFKENVERDLIYSITRDFSKDSGHQKFADLRKKLFNENKEALVKTLTDEAIKNSVEDVIKRYTHRDYHFNWQWKDEIVRIILENWDRFKDDDRIKRGFGTKIDRLTRENESLSSRPKVEDYEELKDKIDDLNSQISTLQSQLDKGEG